MQKLIDDLGAYLKAVFVDGMQKVFTIFDILGIAIFFFPTLAHKLIADESLARIVGGGVLLLSFFRANFSVYRSLAKEVLLLMSPNAYCTAVEVQNSGPGTARDLNVTITYENEDSTLVKTAVREFFSDDALKHRCGANVLTPHKVVCFRLPHKEIVSGKRVTVSAQFTGAESGRTMRVEEEFDLEDQQPPWLVS